MINKINIFNEKRNYIINEINLCFNNVIKNIPITINNTTGKKTRKSKLSYENVLTYSFLYCEMTKSQSKIVSNLNYISFLTLYYF